MNYVERFKFWCQKVLPLVYDDSLSYYEVLNKVVVKLNETVNVVNNLGLSFDELKKYVDDYISGLDIESVIAQKIDEMKESGELAEIINEEIFDELNNKLDYRYYITPEMYGAIGDGVTDDTVSIQNAIDSLLNENKNKSLYFNKRKYLISDTLKFYAEIDGTIFLNGCTIVCNMSDPAIYTAYDESHTFTNVHCNIIGPGQINCMYRATAGIIIGGQNNNSIIDKVLVTNILKYGIVCEESVYPANNTEKNIISNCQFYGNPNRVDDIETVGIKSDSWDVIIKNTLTFNLCTGIYVIGGAIIDTLHHYTNTARYTNLNSFSKTCGINCFRAQISNIYVDAFSCVIVRGNNGDVSITNIFHNAPGNESGNYDWLTHDISIMSNGSPSPIKIANYYAIPHGQYTKIYPIVYNNSYNTITGRGGLVAFNSPLFVCSETVSPDKVFGLTSDANNLCLQPIKNMCLFRRISNVNKSDGLYLLGYLKVGHNIQSGITLVIEYGGVTEYNLKINTQDISLSIQDMTARGANRTFGTLKIGEVYVDSVTGNYMANVYIDGSTGTGIPAYATVNVGVLNYSGVCGFMPNLVETAEDLVDYSDEVTNFRASILLTKE